MYNCNKDNGPMPIQLAPLVGAGLGALQQSKLEKAMSGQKTYTKPKTIFGKLIGGVSGRTAAAEASEQAKSAPLNPAVMNSLQPSAKAQTPITGGFSFGGEATRKTYFPFIVVAGVVAIFYAMRRKKGGRRRY
jgi:hypothetical protein